MQETKKETNLLIVKHQKNWILNTLYSSIDVPIGEIVADISRCLAHSTDAIILRAIIDSGDSEMTMAKLEEVKKKGVFELYPDNTKIFFWDGKPLIKLMPMETKQEGLKIIAYQPYYLLFR